MECAFFNILWYILTDILKCFILGETPLVRLYKHGMSNPTYYVRYAGKEMVLRKKPVSI